MRKVILLVFVIAGVIMARGSDDWSDLCTPKRVDLSQAQREFVKSVDDQWEDLANRQWQFVDTRYHRVYYDSAIDPEKLAHVAGCLDNLYDFLRAWFPGRPEIPIKTFLVPAQYARSRCSFKNNAMRTGDRGDAVFMIASLLHEEVHIFNYSYLGNPNQGWWAGEFSCQYFQKRVRLETIGKDVREYIREKLPDGPGCRFGELTNNALEKFEQAFSAMFFLHTSYGDRKFREFHMECLDIAKANPSRTTVSDSTFRQCFGKGIDELDSQWRAFYGWDVKQKGQTDRSVSEISSIVPAEVAARVVAELASSEYQGRAAGSRGERSAAEFIVAQFRDLGLLPVGSDGNHLHRFNVAYRDIVGPVGLSIRGRNFVYKSDFGVLEGGPAEWAQGQMHFIGFGPGDNSGDIDTEELKGKVLVTISGGQGLPNAESVRTLAEQTKAAGVLLVDPPSEYDPAVFHRRNTKIHKTVPILHVSPAVGEFILTGTGSTLADVCSSLDSGNCPSVDISGVCRLACGVEYSPSETSNNVVGLLRADHQTARNGIIFAHYDGQGRDGESSYHPSANDNASGVAVLLATASLLRQHASELTANMYFAALGAEEVGLVGARALRADRSLPWEQMDFAVCLDMVGHGRQRRLTVQTIDTEKPLYQAFSAYANRQDWQVRPYVRNVLGSDAGAIQRGGIPTLFIVTGDNCWHTVEDNPGNTDSQHMGALSELLAGFVLTPGFEPGTSSERPRATIPNRDTVGSAGEKPTIINTKVTFSSEQISVQYLVRELARQADLEYDWTGSQKEVGELRRRWVHNVNIVDVPLSEALASFLKPLGLTYTIHENVVLLRHASSVSSK